MHNFHRRWNHSRWVNNVEAIEFLLLLNIFAGLLALIATLLIFDAIKDDLSDNGSAPLSLSERFARDDFLHLAGDTLKLCCCLLLVSVVLLLLWRRDLNQLEEEDESDNPHNEVFGQGDE